MTPQQLRELIEKSSRDGGGMALRHALLRLAPLLLELWEAAEVLHKIHHPWCELGCPTREALTALEEVK